MGNWSNYFDANYMEIGYNTNFEDVNFGISAIFNDQDLAGGSDDEILIFKISKSF